METPTLDNTQIARAGHRFLRIERRSLLAAVAVVVGLGLLFWAQQDLGKRQFSTSTLVLMLLGGAVVFAGALSSDLSSLIAAREEPVVVDAETRSRRWSALRLLCLGLSLICTIGAFGLNDNNEFSGRGVVAWFLAIGFFLYVWWEPMKGGRRLRERFRLASHVSRAELLRALAVGSLVIVVVGLAAFLRFYRLDWLPGDAGGIEADIGNDVREVVNGHFYIYFPRMIQEGSMLYLPAALVKFFHVALDYNVLKITSALAGVVGVGLTYLMLKEAFSSRLTAFVGALFMAVSFWPVTISRIALTLAVAPAFAALAMLFLLRALKYNRINDFLLCGLVAGFGLHFYIGMRVLPFLISACLGVKLVTLLWRQRWRESTALIGRGLLLGVMLVIVFAPMARTWHDQPEYYMHMTRVRSQGSAANDFNALGRFGHNLQNAVWMFNWRSDVSTLHNIPYRRSLDPVMGAFLLAGGAIAIGGWLFYRRGPFPYLLLGFIAFLLPSVLVLAFPGENPSAGRAAGVMPLTFGVVALPVSFVLSRIYRALSPPAGLAVSSLLLVGLMVPVTIYNYNWYFDDYHASYVSSAGPSSCLADLIRKEKGSDPSLQMVYFVGVGGWVDGGGLKLMLGQPDWIADSQTDKDSLSKHARNSLYVLNVDDSKSRSQLSSFFPGASTRPVGGDRCPALFIRPLQPSQ